MRLLSVFLHLVTFIAAIVAMITNQPTWASVLIGLAIIYKMDAAA